MEALSMLTGGGQAFGAGSCGFPMAPGAVSSSSIVQESQGYSAPQDAAGDGQWGYSAPCDNGQWGCSAPQDPPDDGSWDMVRIPNTSVGWLKGRQGAMMRDIENRSGCQVDIDQATKHMGYSTARMRGGYLQKKTACGFVIAEVMKVLEQSGEQPEPGFPGHKWEFRVDTQYVGWVKGPQGKVVQDIQLKSSTRIDVDQNTRELGYATVKVFGTHEGVRIARALIATTLAKITPELATKLVSDFPGGYEAAQQIARQVALASVNAQNAQVPAMPQMTDTVDQTAAMASLMAGQQQQLSDMIGAGSFGQQMDASLLNGFNVAAQAAFMQQQTPMQNNFGCGFSSIPDANATYPCFSALPDPNAMNTTLPDPSTMNMSMQHMGDAFGQMHAAQPATSVVHTQPTADPGAQFPTSQPQMPPPSLPPTQPAMQQPDDVATPVPQQTQSAAAAMQLVNSLQQLANAVSQAASQNR